MLRIIVRQSERHIARHRRVRQATLSRLQWNTIIVCWKRYGRKIRHRGRMKFNADSFRAAGRGRIIHIDCSHRWIARRLVLGEWEEILGASCCVGRPWAIVAGAVRWIHGGLQKWKVEYMSEAVHELYANMSGQTTTMFANKWRIAGKQGRRKTRVLLTFSRKENFNCYFFRFSLNEI